MVVIVDVLVLVIEIDHIDREVEKEEEIEEVEGDYSMGLFDHYIRRLVLFMKSRRFM